MFRPHNIATSHMCELGKPCLESQVYLASPDTQCNDSFAQNSYLPAHGMRANKPEGHGFSKGILEKYNPQHFRWKPSIDNNEGLKHATGTCCRPFSFTCPHACL